jgi:hypothetical protein
MHVALCLRTAVQAPTLLQLGTASSDTASASLPRTTMSQTAPTPQDVVEHILDHLRTDTATLRACALVCSSWTLRSQQHLFRRVRLTPVGGNTPVADQWERLLSCLTKSPHLRPHIRTLAIKGLTDKENLFVPANLSRLFPRVSTLQLSGIMQMQLIPALTTLEHLRCMLTCNVTPEYDLRPPYNLPKLRTLEISGAITFAAPFQDFLLSCIEQLGVAGDVESAALLCDFRTDLPNRHFAAFLHTRSTSFRRLELNLEFIEGEGKTRRFRALPMCADDMIFTAWDLGDVLHVEELKITTVPCAPEHTRPAFLALLSTTRFPSLETLMVEILPRRRGRDRSASYRAPVMQPLPHKLLRRLRRVQVMFRDISAVHDLGHLLSIFRLKGRPDIVEVDLGKATLVTSADAQ